MALLNPSFNELCVCVCLCVFMCMCVAVCVSMCGLCAHVQVLAIDDFPIILGLFTDLPFCI